jgi:hypothetical protein
VGTPSVSCPGGVAIDDARPDWVFAGIDPGDVFNGFDCPAREAVSATVSGFVDVGSTPAYLSTYTVDVSGDATEGSTFQVRVDSVPDSALAEFPTLASLPFATGLVCEFSIAKCEVVLFGDVDRDGDVSILDIQCVLDAFSNDFSCGLINTDLVSFGGECGGDGMVDLFDIFAILDAFSLMATCPDPCLPPG